MASPRPQVVLVEDDTRLANLTASYLEQHDLSVTLLNSGLKLSHTISKQKPDLILLDLGLPDIDGIDICKAIRPIYDGPILMLTARDSNPDEILGLDAGADDYLKKPVDPNVLVARVKAQIRRHQSSSMSASESILLGALKLEPEAGRAYLAKQLLDLTGLEFEILKILALNTDKIVSRDTLSLSARGIAYDGIDRTIDIRISSLRKKLNDTAEPHRRIQTVWGKGYMLLSDAW